MLPRQFLFLVLFWVCATTMSQQTATLSDQVGLSAQFYPAGFIPTVNYEHFFNGKGSVVFRLGFNFTDRQDFSDVNLTEEGEGFGGSFGYRKHFPVGKGRIIVGLNTDIWSMEIDWTDVVQESPSGPITPISGNTNILVVQPWLEGGYFLPIKNTKSSFGATLGFGREINVITDGEEVAQGFIGSVSVQYLISI